MTISTIDPIYPPGKQAPPILAEFRDWMKDRPWGCVGCLDLGPPLLEWTPMPWAWKFYREVVPLFRLPDGGAIAEWLHGDERPIVGLGTDGHLEVIANDLRDFLVRLSRKEWRGGPWSDLEPMSQEGIEDMTPELGEWLGAGAGVVTPIEDKDAFERHVSASVSAFEAAWLSDADVVELTSLLTPYAPPTDKPWARTFFTATMVGDQGLFHVLNKGEDRIERMDEALTILDRIRNRMHAEDVDMGKWWSAKFRLDVEGRLHPDFQYLHRPVLEGEEVDIDVLRMDVQRAPRAAAWVPTWISS